jgi:hypothetical protein
MNLSHITGDYIQARRHRLMAENEASKRRERMDRYERMYRLDVYDTPRANDIRVSLPVAPETVEKMRALLVTRPPSITVPYNSADPADMARGQKLEQWLYAAAHRANFQRVLFDAEWFAMCLGMGVIRYYIDPEVPEGDFIIPITAPDPRTVFGLESPGRDRFVEMVHTWPRPRREIENELGVRLNRPGVPFDLEQEAAWLDGEVEFTEYWLETQAREEVKAARKQDLVTDLVAKAMQAQIMGGAGLPPDALDEPEPARKRRVRKIIHAIIVDDTSSGILGPQVLKRAVAMRGYQSIPFVFWSGTSTPLRGANAHLSVLFPLANGDAGDRSLGVLAASNLLASLDLESAVKAPNSPLYTDDPNAQIDLAPDAVNKVAPGSRVDRIQTDVTNPAVVRGLDLMRDQTARHSIPSILSGDNVQQLSGQAISGFATVFQMLIGHKQIERERALESLFSGWLALAEEWGDPVDGIAAWGVTPSGQYVDVTLLPEDVAGSYRTQVKLSASMPQDQIGMISTLSMLQKAGQISMETLLDQVQKLLGLAADTPNDEIVRILRDRWIMDSQFAEQMAQLLAADYRELLIGQGQPLIPPGAMANSQALAGSMDAMLAGAQGQPMPGGWRSWRASWRASWRDGCWWSNAGRNASWRASWRDGRANGTDASGDEWHADGTDAGRWCSSWGADAGSPSWR